MHRPRLADRSLFESVCLSVRLSLQPGIVLFCFVLACLFFSFSFFFVFEEISLLQLLICHKRIQQQKPHERSANGKLNPTKTSDPTKSTNANRK